MAPVETRPPQGRAVAPPPRPPFPQYRRFTVEEYRRMVPAGILHPDERVELLDGVVIRLASMGGRHAWSIGKLNHRLVLGVGERALVNVQIPVHLDDHSQPEPDLALVRPLESPRLARPEDVLLLIEVGDSSARLDREEKAPRYARAGIPELWLVDLEEDLVRVLRRPGPAGWGEETVLRRGDRVAPQAFPELAFEVDELLGPPSAA